MQIFIGLFVLFIPFYLIWKLSPLLFVLLLMAFFSWLIYSYIQDKNHQKRLDEMINNMSEEERGLYDKKIENERLELERKTFRSIYGDLNPVLICPHCQAKESVYAKRNLDTVTTTGQIGGILKTNTKTTTQKWVTTHYCDHCKTIWNV
jgi:uncharacterized protein with PQ loop repeat